MILSLFPTWLVPDTETFGTSVIRIALTLLGAWIVQRVLFLLVWRAERWFVRATHGSPHGVQRARTLAQMSRHLVTSLLGVGVLVHVLEILGWDVKPLLVGASILGAALGFGAQFLVRDLIAGAFILIEDQFAVGDQVEVNAQVATVEAVTLRVTRLRDPQGRVLFVPNGEMKIVVNHSRGWKLAAVELPVAIDQDLGRALAIGGEIAAAVNAQDALREQLEEPLQLVGLERIGPEGAVLRLAARARSSVAAATVAREARRIGLEQLRLGGIRVSAGGATTIIHASIPEPPATPRGE